MGLVLGPTPHRACSDRGRTIALAIRNCAIGDPPLRPQGGSRHSPHRLWIADPGLILALPDTLLDQLDTSLRDAEEENRGANEFLARVQAAEAAEAANAQQTEQQLQAEMAKLQQEEAALVHVRGPVPLCLGGPRRASYPAARVGATPGARHLRSPVTSHPCLFVVSVFLEPPGD